MFNFIKEVKLEIAKVAFPDKQTTFKTLGVVIFFFITLSLYLGALGYIFSAIFGSVILSGGKL